MNFIVWIYRTSVVFRNIEEILAERGEEVKKQIEEGALEIDSKINICKDIKKWITKSPILSFF